MSNSPQGSGNRWWEMRGTGQPEEDEGGPHELMTDSRGRSRPERSLSVGADLADEPGHRSRTFLWPVISVVAAVGLILAVGYVVSTGKHSRPENALPAPPAARSGAPDNTEAKPGVAAKPDGASTRPAPPAQPGPPPAAGEDPRPPVRPPADAPRSPAAPPGGPAGSPGPVVTPNRPIDPPGGSAGGPGGDSGDPTGDQTGNHTTGAPAPGSPAPAQDPPVTLQGSAPATPRSDQVTALMPDTGGGCAKSTNPYYACTLTRDAPAYLAEAKDSHYTVHATQTDPTWFLCQSDGSKYSMANRVNHWWARLAVSSDGVALWVPVVFLTGAPRGDKPVPGLPLCDGATAPNGSAPATSAAPRTKSTGSTPATSVKHP